MKELYGIHVFNPAFCQPKKTGGGGGKMASPPTLAILSQMTVRICYGWKSLQIDIYFR